MDQTEKDELFQKFLQYDIPKEDARNLVEEISEMRKNWEKTYNIGLDAEVAKWNRKYPIGTEVEFSILKGELLKTKTTSGVTFLDTGYSPVLKLEDVHGWCSWFEVDVIEDNKDDM